jgi:hypothetical protein
MRTSVTVSVVFIMLATADLLECRTTLSDPLFTSDQIDNPLAPLRLTHHHDMMANQIDWTTSIG